MLRFVFVVMLVNALALNTHAQFTVEWQKPIGLSRDSLEYLDITCTKQVGRFQFIGYRVKINEKVYPGISYIDEKDSLHKINNFSGNPGLDGYSIVSFVQSGKDSIIALCNDEAIKPDGSITHYPSFMTFSLEGSRLNFLDYYHVNLTDTAGVIDTRFVDGISDEANSYYAAIVFHKRDQNFVNLFHSVNHSIDKTTTVYDATSARLWSGTDGLVITSEIPFAFSSRKTYYQLVVYNTDLQPLRTYPETSQYLDSNASDRMVYVSYRPSYHLGLAARQVVDIKGTNRLNWYGFNGYPNGTYNKLIGEDKNLLIVENTVHPTGEKIIYNYFYPNSGMNNWVVSTLPRKYLDFNSLILSMENYDGLELSRDTVGQVTDEMISDLSNMELLKNVGVGDIDKKYPDAFGFSFDKSPQLYVVTHKPVKILELPGIYITKFSLNTADPKFNADYLTTTYKEKVFYSTKPLIPDNTKKWKILALDPADELSTNTDMIGKEIKFDTLTPVPNTWFWSGDIKIGKKNYHLTRAVIAELK